MQVLIQSLDSVWNGYKTMLFYYSWPNYFLRKLEIWSENKQKFL